MNTGKSLVVAPRWREFDDRGAAPNFSTLQKKKSHSIHSKDTKRQSIVILS
jgi:hypothetical protein